MEDVKDIELLLSEIAFVNKRHDEIAEITGENFNIFNILGLASRETIHSKFIAMLLNPKGKHGKGNLFLELFIKTISIDKCEGADCSIATVYTEKHSDVGRLDIVIITKNKIIIIENKIYSKDSYDQLLRYSNEDAVLLYLTLSGESATGEKSAKKLEKNKDYHCISYREDILKWLKECKKETVNKPFLRETINQYILLVKQLTGQARSNQMENEIRDTISKNADNFLAAHFISENFDKIRVLICKEKFGELLKNLKVEQLGIKEVDTENMTKEFYWGAIFTRESGEKICFQMEGRDYKPNYFLCGILDDKSDMPKKATEYLRALDNYEHSEYFSIYQKMYTTQDFCLSLVSNPADVGNALKDKIKELSKLIDAGYKLSN